MAARSSYALINNLRLHYLSWESEPGGNSAVLLHGLASNARIWDKVGPRLAEAGYRAVAPDQRGHGLTDSPDDGYDFSTLAGDLAASLSYWNITRPLLAGHSWGASVALEYAARYFAGPRAPAGLVLVDGGITKLRDRPGASWENVLERLTPPPLAGMPVDAFLERVQRGQPGWRPDDGDLQSILANFEVLPDETIRPRLSLEHHLQILQALWDFDAYDRLRRVSCPVLVILAAPADQADNEFYQAKKRGVEKALVVRPDLQVIWMPDTVHDIPLQRPVELADSIAHFVEQSS
jgi:pimeloyl-ACP methyl ester carboxylesterase